MATGFMQRFQGKVKAAQLWLGTGGIVNAASGISGHPVYSQSLSLPVTAVTNTDFTMSLPTGAVIQSATVYTTTAYTAVTDAKISIGSSAGDGSYVAATTIKSASVYALTLATTAYAALASAPAASPNIFVRVAQSGGSTAVGAATLVINYTV